MAKTRKPNTGAFTDSLNSGQLRSNVSSDYETAYRAQKIARAYTDSGMVSNFRPAIRTKDPAPLNVIQKFWNKMVGYVSPALTTQQGSAAASPSVTQFLLYSLRYERWQYIADANNIYADDLRARKAINMYAEEAVRKGMVITVSNPGSYTPARVRKAQQVLQDVQDLFEPQRCAAFAKAALVEGDLFLHISTFQDRVINVERRPASAMERNTDDADQFIDIYRAFSQIDTTTSAEVATFPLWQIWHGKWDYMEGDRYGTSCLFSSRRSYRLLDMIEEAQIRRRISRAPQRKHWILGNETAPAKQDVIDDWKNKVGTVEGNGSQYDPVSVGVDYFSNHTVECKVIEGDATVHEIEDLKYFENLYTAGLPTPAPLYNLASGDINRDVLEDMRAQWLNSTRLMNDFLSSGIRYVAEIALLLADIDPDTINFSITWSNSNTETPTDVINRTLLLLNNSIGGGGQPLVRMPLISYKRALAQISEYTGVTNVEEELKAIDADLKANIGALSSPQVIEGQNNDNPKGPLSPPTAPKQLTTTIGQAPLGGVAHSGNSATHVSPMKPLHAEIEAPRAPEPPTAERGIGGSSVGAGQSAAPQNLTYGTPHDSGI